MFPYDSITQILQIHSSKTFLIYDAENYLLSAAIGINDDWCRYMRNRLNNLFRTANASYIIPHDISQFWLDTLPDLPQNLKWTPLLLQEILNKYPTVGFKAISTNVPKSRQTSAVAFVPINSQLMSFADVVTLRIEKNHGLPVRLSLENLRKELRAAGILTSNELLYTLPKALADYRFAWSNDNQNVYVRATF